MADANRHGCFSVRRNLFWMKARGLHLKVTGQSLWNGRCERSMPMQIRRDTVLKVFCRMEEEMTDKQLRLDIIDELDFEPSIDAADIGVAVDQGVVTLTGHVRNYSDKITTLDIVENVVGVRAIADEIEVRPIGAHITADDEIAKRVVNSLKWNTSVPEDKVQITVAKGRVTLEGDVEWRYQADAAARAIGRLTGVTGINNHLKVRPSIKASDVTERIRKTLMRDAELDASGIRVAVHDGTVTLEGKVRYLGERRSAERAAWAAPGVTNVIDHLAVQ